MLESVANGADGTTYVVPEYRATFETRTSARLPLMSVGPPTWTLAVGVKGVLATPYKAVTDLHAEELGSVEGIQDEPLSEYAAIVPFCVTTTNRPVMGLTVTAYQFDALGSVAAIQVEPLSEYAADVSP